MSDQNSIVTDSISLLVRMIGLIILLVGLYIGLKVIFEAWHLYEQPQRIERFATAIEQGSHLDSLLSSLANKNETAEVTSDASQTTSHKPQPSPPIRLTYFLAWGIAVLLLMVIGSLAATAMRTGGQLALYDLQVKQLTKQLGQQSQNKQKS